MHCINAGGQVAKGRVKKQMPVIMGLTQWRTSLAGWQSPSKGCWEAIHALPLKFALDHAHFCIISFSDLSSFKKFRSTNKHVWRLVWFYAKFWDENLLRVHRLCGWNDGGHREKVHPHILAIDCTNTELVIKVAQIIQCKSFQIWVMALRFTTQLDDNKRTKPRKV